MEGIVPDIERSLNCGIVYVVVVVVVDVDVGQSRLFVVKNGEEVGRMMVTAAYHFCISFSSDRTTPSRGYLSRSE